MLHMLIDCHDAFHHSIFKFNEIVLIDFNLSTFIMTLM
jgi:hypothetical protein